MAVLTSPHRTRPRFGLQAGLVAATRGVAFTALMAASPPGGPTAVTMEIPCALSSPKTSSC